MLNNYKIKKCIYLSFDEFDQIILCLTNGLKTLVYEDGEIIFIDTMDAIEWNTYFEEDMLNELSKYFGVEILSIHADDDFPELGFWLEFINYKNKEE